MTLDTLQPFEQSFTVSPTSTSTTPPTTASTKSDESYLLETFHQYPHGDFRPTFYNPFEIKHRRRTSRAQLKVLEKSYLENPKPSAAIRRILAQKLEMTPRGVQIWFQNRRAKAKLLRRKSSSTPSVVGAAAAVDTEEEHEQELLEQQQNLDHFDVGINAINASLNTSDINQSSILFSQFFTNNYAPVESANAASIEAEEDWSVWQLNDNVRTVATTAAAVAAASSSCHQQQQYEMRRRSCPIMPPPPRQHQQQQISMALNQPQASYISPAWSPNMLCNIMSPMPPQAPPQQQQHFDLLAYSQHTPPLTASCSASTVAGSPISLDSLYMNDPVVLPTNQYYNQSPLSATTTYIPDYTMPQFI
ncbi:hypothetical protein MBANPS3_001154 [Mucor bainieri]